MFSKLQRFPESKTPSRQIAKKTPKTPVKPKIILTQAQQDQRMMQINADAAADDNARHNLAIARLHNQISVLASESNM